MIEPIKIKTHYKFKISGFDFLTLLDEDARRDCTGRFSVADDIETIPGVSGVDYHTGFGPVLYLVVEAEVDRPLVWKTIQLILERAGVLNVSSNNNKV